MEEQRQQAAEETSCNEEDQDFMSPWHFSNLELNVEGTKFHVHKGILSMWSPVFETMFTSQFLESSSKEIPLPGKRKDEIKVLLKLIYSNNTREEVTEENYPFLLELAREYQMDKVTKLCREFLIRFINTENCHEICLVAEQFDLEDVMRQCVKEAKYHSSEVLEENFDDLDAETKVDIYMERIKTLENILKKFVDTCSSLVSKAYIHAYKSLPNKPCKPHYKLMKASEKKCFDIKCRTCTNRVQKKCLSYFERFGSIDSNEVKPLVDKLYDLCLDRTTSKYKCNLFAKSVPLFSFTASFRPLFTSSTSSHTFGSTSK